MGSLKKCFIAVTLVRLYVTDLARRWAVICPDRTRPARSPTRLVNHWLSLESRQADSRRARS